MKPDSGMSKTISLILLLAAAVYLSVYLSGCQNIHKTPDGCVVAFIVAAEQRDMSKAWNILGPEAQAYYNLLGEKMRKSGRGALENEIAKITKFRSVKRDYRIVLDTAKSDIVNLVTIGGPTHSVQTVNIEGDYKIKDEVSMRNLLAGITAETGKNEGY
ncbi:MAG: hypothetical protein ACHQIH_00130 [Ignavibacteria bacterium]